MNKNYEVIGYRENANQGHTVKADSHEKALSQVVGGHSLQPSDGLVMEAKWVTQTNNSDRVYWS